MFTAKDIKEHLDAKPFKPFRIFMSDGSSYPIPNHDAAWVTKNVVQVGLNLDKEGIAESSAKCAIIHVTRIEDLQPA